jgi:hypothetical protein
MKNMIFEACLSAATRGALSSNMIITDESIPTRDLV